MHNQVQSRLEGAARSRTAMDAQIAEERTEDFERVTLPGSNGRGWTPRVPGPEQEEEARVEEVLAEDLPRTGVQMLAAPGAVLREPDGTGIGPGDLVNLEVGEVVLQHPDVPALVDGSSEEEDDDNPFLPMVDGDRPRRRRVEPLRYRGFDPWWDATDVNGQTAPSYFVRRGIPQTCRMPRPPRSAYAPMRHGRSGR